MVLWSAQIKCVQSNPEATKPFILLTIMANNLGDSSALRANKPFHRCAGTIQYPATRLYCYLQVNRAHYPKPFFGKVLAEGSALAFRA